jgi:hypothetical protein
MLGLLFYPEDGGSTFFQNVDELLPGYRPSQKAAFFIVTTVRTSNTGIHYYLEKYKESVIFAIVDSLSELPLGNTKRVHYPKGCNPTFANRLSVNCSQQLNAHLLKMYRNACVLYCKAYCHFRCPSVLLVRD